MSPENLLWESPEHLLGKHSLTVDDIIKLHLDLVPHYKRDNVLESSEKNRRIVWKWLIEPDEDDSSVDRTWERALGVYFMPPSRPLGSIRTKGGFPKVEVHSVRTTRRSGPDGQDVRQLVIEVTQRRRGYFDPERQKSVDGQKGGAGNADFVFRGGATLIIDLRGEYRLRYIIRKRIDDDERLQEQRELLTRPDGFGFTYRSGLTGQDTREPFAMTHRGQ